MESKQLINNIMKKRELKIGEVADIFGIKVECEKAVIMAFPCIGCAFLNEDYSKCEQIACRVAEREDQINITLTKTEE